MSVSNEEQKLDYDKARKGPQFAAALAGKYSNYSFNSLKFITNQWNLIKFHVTL